MVGVAQRGARRLVRHGEPGASARRRLADVRHDWPTLSRRRHVLIEFAAHGVRHRLHAVESAPIRPDHSRLAACQT